MAERQSALAHLPGSSTPGARATLSEMRPGSIMQVAAWPETLQAVEATLGEILQISVPRAGYAVAASGATLAAVAPGRYLIAAEAPDTVMRLEAALPASDGTVTDLSHGRAILRLEGEAAAEVLARCIALDLDPTAFPPGRVAQTMIHHVDVLVHRVAQTRFELWVLRSFAESLAEWVLDAGLELNVAFQRS
jgi:heterotetrameric sarcosine oxidase gamma subunit